jgi:hypothetical protein
MKLSPEAPGFDTPPTGEMPPATTASEAEAPAKQLSAERQEILDNMSAADSTVGAEKSPVKDEVALSEELLASMSPEARENAEVILSDFGGVAVSTEVESPYIVSGIDQAEAFANDPANKTEVSGGGGKDGEGAVTTAIPGETPEPVPSSTVTEETDPRKATAEELATINESVKDFKVQPTAETVPVAVVEAVTVPEVVKPISGRRTLDIQKPVYDDPEDQARAEKIVNGRIAKVGTRVQGMRDLRAGRKEIISKQHESLTEQLYDAKGEVWNARGERVRTFLDNNAIKRVGMRSKERASEREKDFKAIDNIKDISNFRRKMLRLQARKNAWGTARKTVEKNTTKAFEDARTNVLEGKDKRDRTKRHYKQTALRPWRRRTTVGGAGSAGILETWGDSASSIAAAKKREKMSEQAIRAQAQRRIDDMNRRRKIDSANAKVRYNARPEDKQKSERVTS